MNRSTSPREFPQNQIFRYDQIKSEVDKRLDALHSKKQSMSRREREFNARCDNALEKIQRLKIGWSGSSSLNNSLEHKSPAPLSSYPQRHENPTSRSARNLGYGGYQSGEETYSHGALFSSRDISPSSDINVTCFPYRPHNWDKYQPQSRSFDSKRYQNFNAGYNYKPQGTNVIQSPKYETDRSFLSARSNYDTKNILGDLSKDTKRVGIQPTQDLIKTIEKDKYKAGKGLTIDCHSDTERYNAPSTLKTNAASNSQLLSNREILKSPKSEAYYREVLTSELDLQKAFQKSLQTSEEKTESYESKFRNLKSELLAINPYSRTIDIKQIMERVRDTLDLTTTMIEEKSKISKSKDKVIQKCFDIIQNDLDNQQQTKKQFDFSFGVGKKYQVGQAPSAQNHDQLQKLQSLNSELLEQNIKFKSELENLRASLQELENLHNPKINTMPHESPQTNYQAVKDALDEFNDEEVDGQLDPNVQLAESEVDEEETADKYEVHELYSISYENEGLKQQVTENHDEIQRLKEEIYYLRSKVADISHEDETYRWIESLQQDNKEHEDESQKQEHLIVSQQAEIKKLRSALKYAIEENLKQRNEIYDLKTTQQGSVQQLDSNQSPPNQDEQTHKQPDYKEIVATVEQIKSQLEDGENAYRSNQPNEQGVGADYSTPAFEHARSLNSNQLSKQSSIAREEKGEPQKQKNPEDSSNKIPENPIFVQEDAMVVPQNSQKAESAQLPSNSEVPVQQTQYAYSSYPPVDQEVPERHQDSIQKVESFKKKHESNNSIAQKQPSNTNKEAQEAVQPVNRHQANEREFLQEVLRHAIDTESFELSSQQFTPTKEKSGERPNRQKSESKPPLDKQPDLPKRASSEKKNPAEPEQSQSVPPREIPQKQSSLPKQQSNSSKYSEQKSSNLDSTNTHNTPSKEVEVRQEDGQQQASPNNQHPPRELTIEYNPSLETEEFRASNYTAGSDNTGRQFNSITISDKSSLRQSYNRSEDLPFNKKNSDIKEQISQELRNSQTISDGVSSNSQSPEKFSQQQQYSSPQRESSQRSNYDSMMQGSQAKGEQIRDQVTTSAGPRYSAPVKTQQVSTFENNQPIRLTDIVDLKRYDSILSGAEVPLLKQVSSPIKLKRTTSKEELSFLKEIITALYSNLSYDMGMMFLHEKMAIEQNFIPIHDKFNRINTSMEKFQEVVDKCNDRQRKMESKINKQKEKIRYMKLIYKENKNVIKHYKQWRQDDKTKFQQDMEKQKEYFEKIIFELKDEISLMKNGEIVDV